MGPPQYRLGLLVAVVVWVLVFTLARFILVSFVFIFLTLNWKSQVIVFPIDIHQAFAAIQDMIWPMPGAN